MGEAKINLINQPEMIMPDGSSIILIHFAYFDRENLEWKVACVPNLEEKDMCAHGNYLHPWKRSDEPRAVTCPTCKKSRIYEQISALLNPARALR